MLAEHQQACYIACFHSPHSKCSALEGLCGGTQAPHTGTAQEQSHRLILIPQPMAHKTEARRRPKAGSAPGKAHHVRSGVQVSRAACSAPWVIG